MKKKKKKEVRKQSKTEVKKFCEKFKNLKR